MLERIWEYMRIVNMVRPRRVLYLAIDGVAAQVAPRAKMNQQRSRRFRAAREAGQKKEVHAKLLQEWLARGFSVGKKGSKMADMLAEASAGEWDSNQITPGTPFM